MSASYVRSDMSGDSSVKHKGGIKNNYRETARGSNGGSVPARTSPNANIFFLWGATRLIWELIWLRPKVQGCNDGRNHKRSCELYKKRKMRGTPKPNILACSGLWREQCWICQFWCLVFSTGCNCVFQAFISPSWSLFLTVWAACWRLFCSIPCVPPCAQSQIAALLLGYGPSYDPRLLVYWPVSWYLFHTKKIFLKNLYGLNIPPHATTMVRAKNQHDKKSLWSLFIISNSHRTFSSVSIHKEKKASAILPPKQ